MVAHADSRLLHMFLWECFGSLGPRPVEYFAMVLGEAGGVTRPRGEGEDCLQSSGDANQSSNKSLSNVIDEEYNFHFRPYVFTPSGIHKVHMFEEGNLEIALAP